MKRNTQALIPEAGQAVPVQRLIDQRFPFAKAAHTLAGSVATYGREVVEGLLGLMALAVLFASLPLDIVTTHLALFAALILSCACAVRYRRGSIYLIAPLITGVYALAYFWRVGSGELPTRVDLFFLLVVPLALSEITRAQRQRIAHVESLRVQDTQRMEALIQHQRDVLAANAELAELVAGMPVTLATICEELTHLRAVRDNDFFEAIVQLVAHALAAESCALYLRRADLFTQAAHVPPLRADEDTALPTDDTVIACALITRRVATIQTCLTQSADSPARCIMAGPLLAPDGALAGLLVVERMPFLQCTPLATQLFTALLPLLAHELDQLECMADGAFGLVMETRPLTELASARQHHTLRAATDLAEADSAQVFALEQEALPDQLIS